MQKLIIPRTQVVSILLANRKVPMKFYFTKKNGQDRVLKGIIDPIQKDSEHVLVRDFENDLEYRSIKASSLNEVVIDNNLSIEII